MFVLQRPFAKLSASSSARASSSEMSARPAVGGSNSSVKGRVRVDGAVALRAALDAGQPKDRHDPPPSGTRVGSKRAGRCYSSGWNRPYKRNPPVMLPRGLLKCGQAWQGLTMTILIQILPRSKPLARGSFDPS